MAEEVFIPRGFREGERIQQLILVCDVDGVVRESVEAVADPRVIEAIQSLLANEKVSVTFISGTPIETDQRVESWRRANISLNRVFGSYFEKEVFEDRVTIFGVLGGQRMKGDGTLEIVDEYSPEVSWELGKLLLHAFLKEVLSTGNFAQKKLAEALLDELETLKSEGPNHTSQLTASEFYPVVRTIREHFDPDFRLISNGALVETHSSNPPWNTQLSSKWLQQVMMDPQYLVGSLEALQKQIATGFGKKGGQGFNYLLVSKTNKGLSTRKHIEKKRQQFPKALIVTIGDTQVDFPMHENAHLSFHVGLEQVLKNHPLSHCMMVRNQKGEDSQHVEGTLKVLSLLKEALGKPFYDFKYIPRRDSLGKWDYYSIQELRFLE